MARRKRGQFPEPKKERGQWKIRYYTDIAQADGAVRRVRKTKCLGKVVEMTLREAKKEAQRFLQPINDVEPGVEYRARTMDQLVNQWRVSVKPNLKGSTQDSYEWALGRILPAFGSWPVEEIAKSDVQAFLADASAVLAPESVYDLKNRLSGLLSVAEEWQWLAKGAHPVRGRLRLPEKRRARPRRILEPDQLQALVMALPPPYCTVVQLAALTGLRRGELAALRWDDVGQNHIEVDEAVYRGKLGTPKTRKSKRRVAIGPAVQAAVEERRKQARFTGPEDFIFGIRTNSPIDLHNVVARYIKPACMELGLPLVSWHDLRYTFTTWGRRAGVQAEAMRDQLGHESVQTTLDIYSQVDDRDAEAARIEAYGWRNGTPDGTPERAPDGLTC